MKIIVTGAGGFIGSFFCDYLNRQGHSVVAVARTITDEMRSALSGCEFLSFDVLDNELPQLKLEADAIVHLAAANDIISKNPEAGVRLSVIGTRNMLQLAANNNIKKFVFYSTLQVYGTELSGELTAATPTRCESDYGINHLMAEQYVDLFARKYQLETAIVRPSNIYGPMFLSTVNRWSLVPGCFCKEIIEKQTITLLSSGKQYRNFISLEELSAQTMAVLKALKPGCQVYNLASKHYYTIHEVAEKVLHAYQDITKREAAVVVKSENPLSSNVFSISTKELEQIGYQPSTDATEIDKEIAQLLSALLPE